MDLFVVRGKSSDDGTPGKLTTSGDENNEPFACDTLELQWRGNKNGTSCILADTYKLVHWNSPHLGPVLRLEDKHGRADCLIHNGNFAGDVGKGEFTQIHGCTEVGHGYGQIALPSGKGTQFGVAGSKTTLAQLLAHVGPGEHTITYSWGEGCQPDDYPGDAV